MSTPAPLPLELPAATRATRAHRAQAGQRSKDRVTSFKLKPEDELVLDALRESYGTEVTGEAIRRALHEAAIGRGIDVDRLSEEAAAA